MLRKNNIFMRQADISDNMSDLPLTQKCLKQLYFILNKKQLFDFLLILFLLCMI